MFPYLLLPSSLGFYRIFLELDIDLGLYLVTVEIGSKTQR